MSEEKGDSKSLFSVSEIAQHGSDTIAQTQAKLADLENAQRQRGTPFSSEELKEYKRLIRLGEKQARDINHLLGDD